MGTTSLFFQDFPEEYYSLFQSKQNCVLLESTRFDQNNIYSFLFTDPVQILQIHRVSELANLLAAIWQYTQQGYYLAGYFAYECGYHIEKLGLLDYQSEKQPLAWFGVYQQPIIYNHINDDIQAISISNAVPSSTLISQDEVISSLKNMCFDLNEAEYSEKISKIQEYICAGDVYQINFTGRYRFTFDGSPLSLYKTLKSQQRVSYSAYIRAAGQDILCLSPELFFSIKGQHIVTRPMKGTMPRGRTLREDQQIAESLRRDSKNCAENVMIVDLLRNDLGRLCQLGSVAVPQLFTVERYNTLFHMTSTVEGTLKEDMDYNQVFKSLFPCGSVTGAPKIRAMEIIKELEHTPRGVYTGSIGYFSPHTTKAVKAMFNVAIRTVVLENGHGEMGVGSGIVYDSVASDEYTECAVKAHFLTNIATPDFDILEAILWDNEYQRLDKHLQRIANSAHYFQYPCEQASVDSMLTQLTAKFIPGQRYKVRLKLNRAGQWTSEVIQLQGVGSLSEQIIVLSSEYTDSRNCMYYHKTTHRALYDRASLYALENRYADVIFLNERGEVTEGATNNLFIERDGLLLTPSLECGLLNGIYRQHILESNGQAREVVLHLKDVLEAEKIYICNAIRGLREVKLKHCHDAS